MVWLEVSLKWLERLLYVTEFTATFSIYCWTMWVNKFSHVSTYFIFMSNIGHSITSTWLNSCVKSFVCNTLSRSYIFRAWSFLFQALELFQNQAWRFLPFHQSLKRLHNLSHNRCFLAHQEENRLVARILINKEHKLPNCWSIWIYIDNHVSWIYSMKNRWGTTCQY